MPIKFTSSLDISNNRITNLGAPTAGNDAVTKTYVDSVATGLVWKDAVRAAATTDIDLANPGAVDGVTLANGDRVLLMGQTDATENGIYTFTGGALTRANDADSDAELRAGSIATVSEGTAQGNRTYVLITDGPITVGSSPLNWTLANNNTAPVYVGGDGIDVDASSHEVRALAANNGGVNINGSGISVKVLSGSGLSTGANGLKVDTGSGLVVGGDDLLAVDLDADSGLQFVNNKLAIKPETDKGLVSSSAGVSVLLRPTGALVVDGTGLAVKVDSEGGLVVGGSNALGLNVSSSFWLDGDNGGALSFNFGPGLTPGAGNVAVKADGNSIAVSNNGVKVKVDPAGSLAIAAAGLGIDTAKVARKYTAVVGNGTDTVVTVTHNLGTRYVGVEVFSAGAPYDTVFVGTSRPSDATVELDFGGTAPASGEYQVLVWG